MTVHKRLAVLILVWSVVVTVSAFGDGLRFVPVEDPVYAFLEYARASGCIAYLPRVRPYTERDTAAMLRDAVQTCGQRMGRGDSWTAARAAEHLARLGRRRDTVLTSAFGEEGRVDIDARFDLTTDAALNRLGDTIPTFKTPFSLSIGLADAIQLSLDVVPAFSYWAWEEEPYAQFGEPLLWDYYNYTHYFDTGTGSFNPSGAHDPGRPEFRIMFNMNNQFSADLGYLTVHAGREALDWGPSNEANLLLSRSAKPYDFVMLDFPLGDSGKFSWMTAILQDFAYAAGPMEERLLSTHRIEYQITDWLYAALYESVVYDFAFELAYLNPLSIYYISEITQGTDDNKLGGADLVVSLPNLELYGSFFADDWDAGHMFELNSSHNEWAAVLGARSVGLTPGLTLDLELTYLSHWIYTHFTWTSVSSVGKSYQHYDAHLGHYLNPNSWMIMMGGRYDLSARTWGATSFRLIQDGRGDINTPPNWSEEAALYDVTSYRDILYRFLDWGMPGFEVNTVVDWNLSGHHYFADLGLAVSASYTFQHSFAQATEDRSRIPDSGLSEHFFTLELSWSPAPLFSAADTAADGDPR